MKVVPPTQENIQRAGEIILSGGVVIMPTETVYGLACNALDPEAVRRVYRIKGRPEDNPLIVHVAAWQSLDDVAEDWPESARTLAERFWPGPLTLVLRKRDDVPDVTTGGLNSVAVRVPSHEVALSLIREAGCPVAAPSANPFMAISPTAVEHLDPKLVDEVDLVIDGGSAELGLESTVVDLTDEFPRILRLGATPRSDIQAVLGIPLGELPPPGVRRSPGMHTRHYAPQAALSIVDAVKDEQAGLVLRPASGPHQIQMPQDPTAYASALYAALNTLDRKSPKALYVERPPNTAAWEAVMDRLTKASAPSDS